MKKKQGNGVVAKNVHFVNFAEQKTVIIKESQPSKSSITDKTTSINVKTKSSNRRKASNAEILQTCSTTNIQTPQQDAIRNFFIQSEMLEVMSGKKRCNIALPCSDVNKSIYKKAISAIVKANLSTTRVKRAS